MSVCPCVCYMFVWSRRLAMRLWPDKMPKTSSTYLYHLYKYLWLSLLFLLFLLFWFDFKHTTLSIYIDPVGGRSWFFCLSRVCVLVCVVQQQLAAAAAAAAATQRPPTLSPLASVLSRNSQSTVSGRETKEKRETLRLIKERKTTCPAFLKKQLKIDWLFVLVNSFIFSVLIWFFFF